MLHFPFWNQPRLFIILLPRSAGKHAPSTISLIGQLTTLTPLFLSHLCGWFEDSLNRGRFTSPLSRCNHNIIVEDINKALGEYSRLILLGKLTPAPTRRE